MKIALVHDHLAQDGGAEKVLKSFSEIWPEAPIYVWLYDKDGANPYFKKKDIRPSFIQNLPFAKKMYKRYLPLLPSATESYDLSEFDVVLSDTASLGKGVITGINTMHICYCHTPTRYLWSDKDIVIDRWERGKIIGSLAKIYKTYLRTWDRLSVDRVDAFIANSRFIAKRIKKYYRRDSVVIYPPIETDRFKLADKIGDFYLIGGRLVNYKRYDLVVKAFNRLGIPLKIFGDGPAYKELKKMANSNIEFLGRISDEEMVKLYSQAIAFLHPQVEDFGITPLESQAAGRPVIAFGSGGALETVILGKTGEFFKYQEWEALAETVIKFKPESYNPLEIKAWAEKFSEQIFKDKMKSFVEKAYASFKEKNN